MAWSWLQSANGTQSGGGSTVAATFSTANLTTGSKIIALVATVNGSLATASGVSAGGNAMTKMAGGVTSSDLEVSLWALDTPSGLAGTKPAVTATFSLGGSLGAILVQEVSGLLAGNTTAMMDGTPGTAGEVTVLAGQAQPSYSSAAASEYLAACFADNGGPETYTVPSGYTADTGGINGSSNADVVIAYKNSTGGAESGTWTFTGTATNAGYIVVAFQLGGPGVTSGPPLGSGMVSRPVTVTGIAGRTGAARSR